MNRNGADSDKGRPRFARLRRIWASPRTWRKVQGSLAVIWLLLGIPSVLWWRDSIPWLVGISVWANVAGHFSGWQGSRAEDNANGSGGGAAVAGWPDNNMLEAAWGIIANVGGGDWTTQRPEWQEAAVAWREAYHRALPPLPALEVSADAGREGSVGE